MEHVKRFGQQYFLSLKVKNVLVDCSFFMLSGLYFWVADKLIGEDLSTHDEFDDVE